MLNKIKVVLQYLLPKHWLTELIGWCAECRAGWLTHVIIVLFVRIYKVDMREVQQPDITSYNTFNAFFIRLLRDNARPIEIDPTVLVMPVDGIISQLGTIKKGNIFQAKGCCYSIKSLLADNETMIKQFYNGSFITIYLTPQDYHHVHMPCNGTLREILYIPGKLFSVNPLITNNIPNLFTRNERLICLFDTDFGPIAQIMIGSIIVGSIDTVWTGTITPPRLNVVKHWYYPQVSNPGEITVFKGQKIGYFKLGSTVINLFSGNNILLDENLHIHHITRVGQRLAYGITSNDNQ